MEQAEKATPETKAERQRVFGMVGQGRIVDVQFLQAVAELFVVVAVHRIEPAEDHRAYFFETGQARFGGGIFLRNGIANANFGRIFDIANQIPDLPV